MGNITAHQTVGSLTFLCIDDECSWIRKQFWSNLQMLSRTQYVNHCECWFVLNQCNIQYRKTANHLRVHWISGLHSIWEILSMEMAWNMSIRFVFEKSFQCSVELHFLVTITKNRLTRNVRSWCREHDLQLTDDHIHTFRKSTSTHHHGLERTLQIHQMRNNMLRPLYN